MPTDRETAVLEAGVQAFVAFLPGTVYAAVAPLEVSGAATREPVPFAKRDSLKFRPYREGEAWGQKWDSAWFRVRGAVPREWKGKTVVASIKFGGEACVFSAEGVPVQGLTSGDAWGHVIRRDRFPVAAPARGGERVDLWVEAAANGLFGVFRDSHPNPERAYDEHYEAKVESVRLCVFDEEAWRLCIEAETLLRLMKSLPERSPQRAMILHALARAADAWRFGAPNPAEVRPLLAPALKLAGGDGRGATTAVGHAHIDIAWLWRIRESIRKCARTFSSQLALIEKYPDYVFGASQPQLYAFVKEHYPGLFKRIQAAVKAGRWEPQGAMWVEADCNLAGGEALVRQILLGKKFYRDEFGVDVRNLWLPDVFGYSAALPQILAQAGVDTFLTQKMSWNQFNKFPHHTFIWRGLDGTGVLTHFPPENNYGSDLGPDKLRFAADNFEERGFLPEFLTLFGYGDGGGGPTAEQIEAGLLQRDMAGVPSVRLGAAQAMFDRLHERRDELKEWRGELYLELHRGTYTTQAANKRSNRLAELQLRRIEMLFAGLPPAAYPAAELDRAWKTVLKLQFHDIIPGSSIGAVYEDSRKDYAEVFAALDALEADALRKLADASPAGSAGMKKRRTAAHIAALQNSMSAGASCLECGNKERLPLSNLRGAQTLSLANTLSQAFRGAVFIPGCTAAALRTPQGGIVPLQHTQDGAWAALELPGLSCTAFTADGRTPKAARISSNAAVHPAYETAAPGGALKRGLKHRATPANERVLENALVRYEFDRGGRLVRAFDKETGREAMRPGDAGNVLSLYQDWPNYWDAWDIEQQAERQRIADARLLDFRPGGNGPAMQTLELEWAVGESRLTQEVRLAANSKRLDFVTKADWRESRKLLRVAFPVDVEAAEASFEVQFGVYKRPTHRNTSWDAARFEVCAHRFADLSEADYGVALLNDCKYGCKVEGRTLELSLLRAPFYPDPKADRGAHIFTYSLLPHAGRLEDSEVMAQAHALNQPPVVAAGALKWALPLEVTGGGVLVEAVKRAESGKGWIVRLYEPRGVRAACEVRTRSPKTKLAAAGIMEEARENVPLAKGAATLRFRPFEIKTLLVTE